MEEFISKTPPEVSATRYGIDLYKQYIHYQQWVMGNEMVPPKEVSGVNAFLTNDVEDLDELSFRRNAITTFRTFRVTERYGLSIKEWLDMPKSLADDILNQCVLEQEYDMQLSQKVQREVANDEKAEQKLLKSML